MSNTWIHSILQGGSDGARASPLCSSEGTQILIENFFYNVVSRRKSFKNLNDEYEHILDVISWYVIHKINVSFSCKKHGDNKADIHTIGLGSRIDAIRSIYGPAVARELVEIIASDNDSFHFIFKMEGFISSFVYQ